MHTKRHFFQKSRHFFSVFKKGREDLPPTPTSCALAKVVVDVSRGTGGRTFLFSWDRLNKIFKILKMFKCNMKFTIAACWINSKISNRDKNTTLCCVECKIRSKTMIQNVLLTLKPIIYCVHLEHHYQNGLFCSKFFAYPSSKLVICGPELNL